MEDQKTEQIFVAGGKGEEGKVNSNETSNKVSWLSPRRLSLSSGEHHDARQTLVREGRRSISTSEGNNSYTIGAMEVPTTGTGSKLQQLLMADRNKPLENSAGNVEGGGDDATNPSTEFLSDKYKNPRKRLLMSSLKNDPRGGEVKAPINPSEDKAVRARKVMKWRADRKSDETNSGNPTASGTQGSACLKVAPIVLKKYYPSAVQSAECEEFLVSVSEDDSQESLVASGQGTDHTPVDTETNQSLKKNDHEHMEAEIEKLLKMPSPQKSWKKPMRQRKFQCTSCSKSYSTEEDLKSHSLSHSATDVKIFYCKFCDNRQFKWIQSLRLHMKNFHSNDVRNMDPASYSYTSVEKQTEGKQDVKVEKEMPVEKRSVLPPRSAKLAKSTSEESGGEIADGSRKQLGKEAQKLQTITERRPRDSRGRMTKSKLEDKASKPSSGTKKEEIKSKVRGKEKPPVAVEDVDESIPDVYSGRASLRRNIQRPKWLTDSDLVTDYEFPRGTNSMRSNSATSSPATTVSTPTASITNGAQSQSRASVKDKQQSTKTQKVDNKIKPRISTTRPRPTSTVAQIVKEPKKKDPIVKKPDRQAPEKKEKPIKKRREPYSVPSKPPPASGEENESPTKQLSTQILALSLEDMSGVGVGGGNQASPSASPKMKGSSRKRSERGSTGSRGEDKEADTKSSSSTAKRRKTEEDTKTQTENSASDDSIKNTLSSDFDASRYYILKKNDEGEGDMFFCKLCEYNSKWPGAINVHVEYFHAKETGSNRGEKSDSVVGLAVASRTEEETMGSQISISNDLANGEVGKEIHQSRSVVVEEMKNEKATDSIDSKKLGEAQFSCESTDEVTQQVTQEEVMTQVLEPSCQDKQQYHFESSTGTSSRLSEPTGSIAEVDKRASTSPVNKQVLKSPPTVTTSKNDSPIPNEGEAGELLDSISKTDESSGIFLKNEDVTFADVAKVKEFTLKDIKKSQKDTEGEETVKSNKVHLLPINDEDMPILKPETADSTVASPVNSESDRMESVDEEISSNSNHSTILPAPVLSKEATTFPSGLLKAPENAESVDLEELPLMEDAVIGSRRDRSDSMSVRSCGSGSPSEKIKALEDAKEKDPSVVSDHENEKNVIDQDSGADSDTNDSLMSEFSELAAQVSEKTDGVKFKKDVMRFLSTKVSANSMWAIRKELKRLKKDKNYFKFGKLSPLAAGLMHDLFCQSLD